MGESTVTLQDLLTNTPALSADAILVAYRGSIAHGMYVPSTEPTSIDDKDLMAVCVPDISHYYGLRQFGARGTKEIKQGEWDVVIYEVRKFIRLLAQGNPNVLAMLWTPNHLVLCNTPAGQLLIDKRHLFNGKHVYNAFVGYAHLKRMEGDGLIRMPGKGGARAIEVVGGRWMYEGQAR